MAQIKKKIHPFFLIGNWKMYGNRATIENFSQKAFSSCTNVRPILCPPHTYLMETKRLLSPKNYLFGAQNCSHYYDDGPWTGEVSAPMLADSGCDYCIVGHCEREVYEDVNQIHKKIHNLLKAAITPIMCVRSLEDAWSKLSLLHNIREKIMIAYEPAVGADCPPEGIASDAHVLNAHFPSLALLYGGGVRAETLGPLMPFFDGFLVGRASTQVESWNHMYAAIIASFGF